MEERNASNADLLVNLLSQGNDQVTQLEAMVHEPCKPLARQLRFIILQSISLAKSSWQLPPIAICPSNRPSGDSPTTNTGSPQSENSDRIIKVDHERKEMSKKRKLPRWTKQARVPTSAEELERVLNDGFTWRKYGQKDILRARHPRSYYRCTHKNTLGCPATKHVQKSEDDRSLDISYRGEHTCRHQQPASAASSLAAAETEEMADDHQQLLLSFKTNLKVKTDVDMEGHQYSMNPSAASFSFQASPSTSAAGNHMIMNFSSAPSTLESHFMGGDTSGDFSPSPFEVVSPAASDPLNYATFSAGLQCHNGAGGMPLMMNTAPDQSELTEIFNALDYTNSTSPMVDSSPYMLDHYPFDASNFCGKT